MKTRANIRMVAAGVAAVLLGAILPASAADGIWTNNGSGNWSDAGNWDSGIVADGAGFTATFANEFTSSVTITNDSDRTIGNIEFLSTGNFNNSIKGTNTITLDDPSGTSEVYVAYVFNRALSIEAPIDGTNGLTKTGAGALNLTGANSSTYTGGTVINEGILNWHEYNANTLGDPSSPLIVNGLQINAGNKTWTSTRPVFFYGDCALKNSGNGNWNCAGPVGGTGNIELTWECCGGYNLRFSCLTNTFTGDIGFSSDNLYFYISSILDSPGAGNIYWRPGTSTRWLIYQSNATNALVLNNRRIELRGDGNLTNMRLRNANSDHEIVINTDLLVSGSGNKTLVFDASSAGVTNVIAGDISDGTNGAVVAFTQMGNGDLILSGNNTYSGTNTFSGSGTLFLEGEASLPDDGSLNITGSGKVQVEKREKIAVLLTNGVPVDPAIGIWGSSTSGAANTNDTYFSGMGVLYVGVDFPPSGTVIVIE